MTEEHSNIPEPIRIAEMGEAFIAGLGKRYTSGAPMNIPELWDRFNSQIDKIPAKKGTVAYGLCFGLEKGIEYLCGIEVSNVADLPEEYSYKELPAQRYAVFAHKGHVSTLRNTIDAIWNKAIPNSDHKVAEGAGYFFERYSEDFDPQKGMGGIEIWIPVKQ